MDKDNEIETLPSLEELKSLRVKDLKELLGRHHENTSGKKADLVLRCYMLIEKKRLSIEATDNEELTTNQGSNQPVVTVVSTRRSTKETTYEQLEFEVTGCVWKTDLRALPSFNFVQLYDYLVIKTTKYDHSFLQTSGYKKLKAYQFFKEGHIKNMHVASLGGSSFVKAEVLASMKQQKYKVMISFNNHGTVLKGACKCPAGRGIDGHGHCNHIGGVLFAMEDFCHKGLREHSEPLSCTSKLCRWNVPRNVRIDPKPVDDIIITKYRFGKEANKFAKNSLYDPRAPADRQINNEQLQTLSTKLSACLQNSSFFLFYDIKPQQVADKNVIVDSFCESSPENAPDIEIEEEMSDLPFNDQYNIASTRFKSMIDTHIETITDNEVELIERMTRGQSTNDAWRELKKIKLTASNFKAVAKRTLEPDKLLKRIMYIPKTSRAPIPSLEYGQTHEAVAVKDYVTVKVQDGNPNLRVWEVGTIISKVRPGYGASVDRMVFDPLASGKKQGGLEVKCPYSKRGTSVQAACQDKNFCSVMQDNGEAKLKSGHPYYYQVQGQMFVCNLNWVDFVIWFGPNNLNIERICFNKEWWYGVALPEIDYFYRKAFLPEVLTGRVARGVRLYNHNGWRSFKDASKLKRSA